MNKPAPVTYNPVGPMKRWYEAMKAEPDRIWTTKEISAVLEIAPKRVHGHVSFALSKGAIYRGKRGRWTLYALKDFPPDERHPRNETEDQRRGALPVWEPENDMRIPKVVAGWTPPKMVCARLAA